VSDPFGEYRGISVRGGALNLARAGPPADAAAGVALAVHGITASLMAWRSVARELCGRGPVCLLAPDLRGRGRSATLPGPYGMSAHVADLLAVLDHAGVPQAVVVGHSLGAHIAARLAADHPARVASLVLIDGGLPVPQQLDGEDEELEAAAMPAVDRMDEPAASADTYLARWRRHPALASTWNADVEAYARYDMAHDDSGARCVVSEEAVMADSFDLMLDGTTRRAIERVPVPIRLLHAPRGVFDEHQPVIAPSSLQWLRSERPDTRVELVPDVNHYTLLLGDGPGPARVAAAITEATLGA
jgi:lipase